jgi:glycosyltransferase involved in cell wall biosynthesis
MSNVYKIGVWVNDEALPSQGGGYYYSKKIIQNLEQISLQIRSFEIYFIGYKLTKKYNTPKIELNRFKDWGIEKIPFIGSRIRKYRKNIYENSSLQLLSKNDIKLIFYPSPEVEFVNFPFIINNWDIGHKSMYAFPEVSNERQFFKREAFYKNIVSRALYVCVESNSGKEEIIKYYNFNPDRIKILPIFSGEVTEKTIIENKPIEIGETDEYLFYPAQYWAHKNHYNLILAFNELLKRNKNLKLIFTGSDKGNLNYLKSVAKNLNINNEIFFFNFIGLGEIKWLYKNALALVMPTFLGPTNMPIIEAMELNCPVACSDLIGHREILGDNGVYFNPTSFVDMAKKIEYLVNTKKAKTTLDSYFNIDKTIEALISIIEESKSIRNCWD